jgi:hypothetical protein
MENKVIRVSLDVATGELTLAPREVNLSRGNWELTWLAAPNQPAFKFVEISLPNPPFHVQIYDNQIIATEDNVRTAEFTYLIWVELEGVRYSTKSVIDAHGNHRADPGGPTIRNN